MEHELREQGPKLTMVMDAVADLEHIVDWSESGDTGRLSESEGWHVQFAIAVRAALDSSDEPDVVIGRIALARALLERRLSGEEWAKWAADVFARSGRVLGPNDPRGAEAKAYDRLVELFDSMSH